VRTKQGGKGGGPHSSGLGEWTRHKGERSRHGKRTHVPNMERWVGRGLGERARVWRGAPKGGHVRAWVMGS
jgi:hypothetical protein